jgi:hypothetical protein
MWEVATTGAQPGSATDYEQLQAPSRQLIFQSLGVKGHEKRTGGDAGPFVLWLCNALFVVPRAGIEPATPQFSVEREAVRSIS